MYKFVFVFSLLTLKKLLRRSLKKLDTEVNSLRQQNQNLEDETQELRKRVASLGRSKTDLEKNLQTKINEIDRLSRSYHVTQERAQKLQEKDGFNRVELV